ncbi:leucine-rich repeat domain-containing protein [Candidatus Uabimicrobium sp. HlEnr_7]|uniref:leucine-rich repeat domain-containing protein n=1 Tax=Candidatus Uabimicrobium helgolandensis TaxID=3095367 RepID=UPI0035562AB2
MKIVEQLSLIEIESNTTYKCCAFYLEEDKWYDIENSRFFNCSFRSDIQFERITNCSFSNCTFSKECFVDLSHNSLWKIPDSLFSIVGMTSLKLKLCCSDGINSSVQELRNIKNLENLEYLDLSNCSMGYLPLEITQLENLQNLDLKLNRIFEIPYEICELKNLFRLNLSYNQLRTLPCEIGKLKSLSYLNLRTNRIDKEEKILIKSWLPDCDISF